MHRQSTIFGDLQNISRHDIIYNFRLGFFTFELRIYLYKINDLNKNMFD